MIHEKRDRVQRLRQKTLVGVFFGDVVILYLTLCLAFYLRFELPVSIPGLQPLIGNYFFPYQPLFALGLCVMLLLFSQAGLYDWKRILQPRKVGNAVFWAVSVWFVGFLFLSLTLRIEPTVSRGFVVFTAGLSFLLVIGWRRVFSLFYYRSGISKHLSQKVLFIGWNHEAAELAAAIGQNKYHPYEITGFISTEKAKESAQTSFEYPSLGTLSDLDRVIQGFEIDLLIVADLQMTQEDLERIIRSAERNYTQFKILPSIFQIFISGLRLETISDKPLLGVEEMAIERLFGRLIKRLMDIAGASLGLLVSSPVLLLFAWLIKREDPGPVFFKQERIGRNHKPFTMYKLRSMALGADRFDSLNQSTLREDPRLLKWGKFMRKYNIDELPQFWNVLKGEMSLVGPRPERTHFVDQLSGEIRFYNIRHLVKPGMTGWAQINGFRGDTDLSKRIRYDIYYIENWSFWRDVQCLLMTFLNRKNAY